MKDDLNRITIAQWGKIKELLPIDNPENDYTPKFGTIVDAFRMFRKIYISVTPISDNGKIIHRYRSIVYRLSENNIINVWNSSEQTYYLAMRNAIDKACDFILE